VAFGTAFDESSSSAIFICKDATLFWVLHDLNALFFHLFHFLGNHTKVDALRFFCVGFARFWDVEDSRLAGPNGEALRLGSPWLGHIELSRVNHFYRATGCYFELFSLILPIVSVLLLRLASACLDDPRDVDVVIWHHTLKSNHESLQLTRVSIIGHNETTSSGLWRYFTATWREVQW